MMHRHISHPQSQRPLLTQSPSNIISRFIVYICRRRVTIVRGVAIFAKVCFGHQAQANSKNLTRPFMPSAHRPSCVRCVITSSRLYTTPSVTLRRHKAAAASSSSSARALNYE
ncbi:hypothetical protein [Candidatus Reidiella endopervernicosa]|uniref:Uncharacterized protein n=1 Tax=Candidatus Reidiella endopervernicosa TaxID=2738883 RepID=A0A6N0HW94_9GAMM|nr:hypothetical protein [Candidatus Reidiella endopervernicosa]QKQ26446.1 hypothetical protein HUE57_09275 [Candidatus Reidiella endopervernicosa]